MRKVGVYVHIPVCKSKCIYCAFLSFKCGNIDIDRYIDNLVKEIDLTLNNDILVDTLYIGGGTPSILDTKHIHRIIDAIKSKSTYLPREVTIECNPESLTEEKIIAYKDMSINRISMGVQSINDDVLRLIHRVHSSREAIDKAKLVKKYNLNLSVDLILGLPHSTKDDIVKYIDTFSSIGANHISTYSLSVEEGTPLEKLVKNGDIELLSEDDAVDQYDLVHELLEERGYHRYEISNFARDGFYSIHNTKYWEMEDYIGLGLGSHSYYMGERYYNTSSTDEYNVSIENGVPKHLVEEHYSKKEALDETIMLGLRLEKGVDISKLDALLDGKSFIELYRSRLDKVKDYIIIGDNRLKIKPQYMNVMNSIILKIIYD